MNPASENTAVLGAAAEPGDGPRTLAGLARNCHRGAIALAVVALAVLVLGHVPQWSAWTDWAAADNWALTVFAVALGSIVLARAGIALRRRADAALGLIDAMTGLRNRRGLAEAGEALLAQCRAQDAPLTLVVLDFDDLAEVPGIYGREVGLKVLARVVRKVGATAGERGLAARTGKTQFTVLLPGMNRERARSHMQRMLGKPCRVEFDAGDSEIVLVPDILAETAAPDDESVDKLYQEVSGNIAQMRMEEARRQHWLQRERERHSRPASLPGALPRQSVPTGAAPLSRT